MCICVHTLSCCWHLRSRFWVCWLRRGQLSKPSSAKRKTIRRPVSYRAPYCCC
ncbi:hypothetical protein M9458_017381, partial [Cirrhinus mrigala]